MTCIWLLFLGFMSEESPALLRGCIYGERDYKSAFKDKNIIRIISFNCAGGNPDAVKSIYQYAPDIVLLQESPSIENLSVIAKELFADEGGFVKEGDTAILARGQIRKTEISKENRSIMVCARINLPSGLEIEAASVHLIPPASALNLFSPSCWREHREDRRLRLQQIVAIKEHLDTIEENVPLLVGGDFNANPWVGASKLLSLRLYDIFKMGGAGWPGTGPDYHPLWRVDQIWVGKQFRTIKVFCKNSKYSDHRIVICDLNKI